MGLKSITSAQIIVGYGLEQGWNLQALLQSSGLSALELSSAKTLIESHQELAILQNLATLCDCPVKAGAELGRRYQITSYGMFGFALLSRKTGRDAAEFALKHMDLSFAFCDFSLNDEGEMSSIDYRSDFVGQLEKLIVSRDMWASLQVLEQIMPAGKQQIAIEMTFLPEPENIRFLSDAAAEDKRISSIRFSQTRNRITVASNFLDQALPQADEITAKMCEQQCLELLNNLQASHSVSYKVKTLVLNSGFSASMDDIAKQLAKSSRTLHRQLQKEGSSWRLILESTRCEKAKELLKGKHTIDDIATTLGYSEVSNFSHAFRRLTGNSPSEYRTAHLPPSHNPPTTN